MATSYKWHGSAVHYVCIILWCFVSVTDSYTAFKSSDWLGSILSGPLNLKKTLQALCIKYKYHVFIVVFIMYMYIKCNFNGNLVKCISVVSICTHAHHAIIYIATKHEHDNFLTLVLDQNELKGVEPDRFSAITSLLKNAFWKLIFGVVFFNWRLLLLKSEMNLHLACKTV